MNNNNDDDDLFFDDSPSEEGDQVATTATQTPVVTSTIIVAASPIKKKQKEDVIAKKQSIPSPPVSSHIDPNPNIKVGTKVYIVLYEGIPGGVLHGVVTERAPGSRHARVLWSVTSEGSKTQFHAVANLRIEE